ncbi:phosphotransferase [Nocardioides sp. GY 10113]|uniref:phosphotransferase n=1 Tax=Nocardioides sp. GY 10113 TaxID=2569761 RepID=UPI0010A7CB98|nr:phosphotransferase [Nocardioides sp. GY 10113]TIC87798.1 phosphotransferase [Nocardioides sp. GY 10113]
MWQPEPEWLALPGGSGTSTVGVWRTAHGGRPVVVKRLAAPGPGDPAVLSQPDHVGYWRREADVLLTGLTAGTRGLRSPAAAVEEDAEGITITRDWVEDDASSGLFLAVALGRFAGVDLPRPRFLAAHLLRDRLERVARRGGWPTLARTTVADVADVLWRGRNGFLEALEGLPQVPQHGDPTAANLPGRDGDDAIAIDWGTLGHGPVGGDLGYLSLSSREEFEPLLDAYLLGLPAEVADRDAVVTGARVVAVFTALSRAEWALARVATGEGALASKYRHPAVAPHLRTLQRTFPMIEALLER